MSLENPVVATNDDAVVSKLSAVTKGYYKDEFLKYFTRKPVHREPLINRGYYARVLAWQNLITQFLEAAAAEPVQIVSLGAGFDTTFFTFKHGGRLPATARWFELDLPSVVERKSMIVARHPRLSSLIEPLEAPSATAADAVLGAPRPSLNGAQYRLAAADLCDVSGVERTLRSLGIDFSLRTLLLSECVLVYLPVQCSDAIVSWAAGAFDRAAFATYEQIRPDDAFGRTMLRNLQARGCPLESLTRYGTLASQIERYRQRGWAVADAADMQTIWTTLLDVVDAARVEALEFLDELEEWQLFQQHYCIVVARSASLDVPKLQRATPTAPGAALGIASGVVDTAAST
eukprot:TRINITY_DN1039_c0_g1_i4.p1 TRINITY_DN1039_c0_g1~~TRINITY_DN1039_c0_g1_i4.p1  ORF type:complete len:346 (+),score=83.45 TRINITY_DN1039_c0_g1_i4:295-1332(+)